MERPPNPESQQGESGSEHSEILDKAILTAHIALEAGNMAKGLQQKFRERTLSVYDIAEVGDEIERHVYRAMCDHVLKVDEETRRRALRER